LIDIDPDAPQTRVAQLFMERKGLGDLKPVNVEKVDGEPCWYFTYHVDAGSMELEVFWDEAKGEWETTVTGFTLTD